MDGMWTKFYHLGTPINGGLLKKESQTLLHIDRSHHCRAERVVIGCYEINSSTSSIDILFEMLYFLLQSNFFYAFGVQYTYEKPRAMPEGMNEPIR